MLRVNSESLVEVSVCGQIVHPEFDNPHLSVGYDGKTFLPVGAGGITYNVKVGDRAFGWDWGDQVEPGVTIRNADSRANNALNLLACIGNEAFISNIALDSRDKAKGITGSVTGKRSTPNGVLVYFNKKLLERLCIGDVIHIKAVGQGLKLLDYTNIVFMNISPSLFKIVGPTERSGRIRLPVTKIVPGKIMGSGIGSTNSLIGDYEIQSVSDEVIKEYGLDSIRLGDFIAITDHDCTYGPRYHDGAITIGVVSHGASRLSGHGPGVTVICTSSEGLIEPIVTRKANLAEFLDLQ